MVGIFIFTHRMPVPCDPGSVLYNSYAFFTLLHITYFLAISYHKLFKVGICSIKCLRLLCEWYDRFYLPQTVVQVLVPDFFALMRIKMSPYAKYKKYFSAQSQKALTVYCLKYIDTPFCLQTDDLYLPLSMLSAIYLERNKR